jgi:hypothetical protein
MHSVTSALLTLDSAFPTIKLAIIAVITVVLASAYAEGE